MWVIGLPEDEGLPEFPVGIEIVQMAVYVCPFDDRYTGSVTIVQDGSGARRYWDVHLMALKGEDTEHQDMQQCDNLFVALMEFENARCATEVIVNQLATENINRISRWN